MATPLAENYWTAGIFCSGKRIRIVTFSGCWRRWVNLQKLVTGVLHCDAHNTKELRI